MKKKLFILLLIVLFFITGCKNSRKLTPPTRNEMYYNIKRLDTYLYEIYYDDYLIDLNEDSIIKVDDFACSSVRNGNFYGRNFDFIYNDIPEYVVHMSSSKNRHASIGVTTIPNFKSNDNIEDEYYEELDTLPNFMLDGINDSGVIISDNVVPKEDVAPITGTNPEGEDLHITYIVRYILDNASSADNAIELLKERNIYGSIGEHFNLHFMIADMNKTYVVEFIDNKMVVEEKKDNEQVMTNYYVNLDEYTENAAGIERYNILKDYYEEGNSFEGMWNLLQRVKYSTAYLFNNETEWYSEFIPQSIMKDLSTKEAKQYLEHFDSIKKDYWVARGYDKRTPANELFWQTTHNSTYDIKKRKLRVTIQENYNKYYEFELD